MSDSRNNFFPASSHLCFAGSSYRSAMFLNFFSPPSPTCPLFFTWGLLLLCHRLGLPSIKHLLINWPPAPSPLEVSGEPGLAKLKLREVK